MSLLFAGLLVGFCVGATFMAWPTPPWRRWQ